MTEQELQRMPNEGEAAYFVKLHLTTVRCKPVPPNHKGELQYEVKGKPRPFLVIRVDPKRRWFLALPITSKSRAEKASTLEPIGNCLNEAIEDYVEMEIHKLPENMLHREDGRSPVLRPCHPEDFSNAVRVVTLKALGAQSHLRHIVG